MLIVPIHEAQAGMKLAACVLDPQNPELELLKRGYLLDPLVISRLKEKNVESIYVDYPGLEDLDRHLMPELASSRVKIYSQVRATIQAVQKTAQPTVGFTDYYASIRELVISLLSKGDHPVYLDLLSSQMGSDAINHASTVAHLATMLGIHLRTYLISQRSRLDPAHASEVVNIGVAGMLHDIGKAKLPESLRHYSDLNPPTKENELKVWEHHAYLGYEMLKGGVESSAAGAVLHHHQHYDGTGFPKLKSRDGELHILEGQHIHVFARILRAADCFTHLSTQLRGNRAILKKMEKVCGDHLDPVVFQALQAVVPPYPPGTRVLLNTRQKAVVVQVDPAKPLLPTIRVWQDSKGKTLSAPINLANQAELQLVD